jgi:hypothetical protein
MFIFISGAMGPLTGNVRKGFQNVKKEWVSGLLLPLSVPVKEFALLKN